MHISKVAVHYEYVFQKLRQCALLKLLVCTEDGKRCLNASLSRHLQLMKNMNCHDDFDFVKEILVCSRCSL